MPQPVKLNTLSKMSSDGQASGKPMSPTCDNPPTEGTDFLELVVNLGRGPCDDGSTISGLLNGKFIATVMVVRLNSSQRGYFIGRWRIEQNGSLMAEGTLVGTVGAGTHHGQNHASNRCEQCGIPEHYEGTLRGRVQVDSEFAGAQIYASLVGTGPLAPDSTDQRVAIEGVVESACR